jgi:predicted HicB family RNase H-like nuclease
MMEYKGYIGRIEIDEEAGLLHGEVVNTRDVITFQGDSLAEVKQAFQESIDDYLDFCRSRGESPDKPFSGQFVTRIPPDLHRQVNAAALRAGKSLNAWVAEQLEGAVLRAAERTPAAGRKRTTTAAKRKRKATARKDASRKPKESRQHA